MLLGRLYAGGRLRDQVKAATAVAVIILSHLGGSAGYGSPTTDHAPFRFASVGAQVISPSHSGPVRVRDIVAMNVTYMVVNQNTHRAYAIGADWSNRMRVAIIDTRTDRIVTHINLSAAVSIRDLKEPGALIESLKLPRDPVSAYLKSKLSGSTRALLNTFNARGTVPERLLDSLLLSLNAVIAGPCIYNSARFANVAIDDAVRWQLQRNPTGRDLAVINRLLLDAAYNSELVPLLTGPMLVDPVLNRVYVQFASSEIQVIDARTNRLLKPILDAPWGMLSVDPADHRLYDADSADHLINVFDTVTQRRLGVVSAGAVSAEIQPSPVSLDPALHVGYAIAMRPGRRGVVEFDTKTLHEQALVWLPAPLLHFDSYVHDMSVDTHNHRVYVVAVSGHGTAAIYRLDGRSLTPKRLPFTGMLAELAYDAGSNQIIFGDAQYNCLSFVDARSLKRVAVFTMPFTAYLITPDDPLRVIYAVAYGLCVAFKVGRRT